MSVKRDLVASWLGRRAKRGGSCGRRPRPTLRKLPAKQEPARSDANRLRDRQRLQRLKVRRSQADGLAHQPVIVVGMQPRASMASTAAESPLCVLDRSRCQCPTHSCASAKYASSSSRANRQRVPRGIAQGIQCRCHVAWLSRQKVAALIVKVAVTLGAVRSSRSQIDSDSAVGFNRALASGFSELHALAATGRAVATARPAANGAHELAPFRQTRRGLATMSSTKRQDFGAIWPRTPSTLVQKISAKIVAHFALVRHAGEATGAGQHAQQRHFRQAHRCTGAIVNQNDLIASQVPTHSLHLRKRRSLQPKTSSHCSWKSPPGHCAFRW